jgi:hypothetical protein
MNTECEILLMHPLPSTRLVGSVDRHLLTDSAIESGRKSSMSAYGLWKRLLAFVNGDGLPTSLHWNGLELLLSPVTDLTDLASLML